MRGRDSIRSIGHGDKKYSEERERERDESFQIEESYGVGTFENEY